MPSFVHIDASEVHALARDLDRHADQAPEAMQRIVTKGGFDIEATMHVLVPVDTGATDNSIGTDIGELSFVVGPTTEYAPYVEEGTSRMAAQPFAGPAFDHHLPSIESAAGDLVGSVLGRA